MKIKLLISSLIMVVALMASSVASAGVIWSGTVDDWTGTGGSYLNPPVSRPNPGEIKYDNIMSFNADPAGMLTGDLNVAAPGIGKWIDVAISELIAGAETLYAVVFTPNILNIASPFFSAGGYSGSGGNFEYSMTSLNDKLITSVALDSTTLANKGEYITKELFDNSTFSGTPFLTLTSLNGNTDPLLGHVNFTGRQTVYVRDTLFNTGGSRITQVSNEFNTVPEPMTLIMLGLGLLGFGYSRRHILSDVKGLSA
jgi:hypothetical protein